MNWRIFSLGFIAASVLTATAFSQSFLSHYKGLPFHDSRYSGGPQKIPGKLLCAYYDLGGEGVAYHDSDPKNHGSGELNPADGSYLNEFRIHEGVDTSYTKFQRKPDPIDDNPFDKIVPPPDLPYVGWTEPGEWFNVTVDVAQIGNPCSRFPLHIEPRWDNISGCEWKGRNRTARDHHNQQSCRPVGLASVAPLEFGATTFQNSSGQRKKCPHRTHIDERKRHVLVVDGGWMGR